MIGLDCGECETEAFWREFLPGLVKRVLSGVQLVVSDAHEGLKQAIGQVLSSPWQRCTVHFLREGLGHARREQQPMLAALIRQIFNAETGEQARQLIGEAIAYECLSFSIASDRGCHECELYRLLRWMLPARCCGLCRRRR